MTNSPVAVILAAGKGTRMNSSLPKVLHEVCARPMVEYVMDAARDAGVQRLIVVVGHEADLVKQTLAHHDDVEFALQSEQLGTGHAVMMCEPQLTNHNGPVLVLAGDTPLLKSESLSGLLADLQKQNAACVIGTAATQENQGLGRIIRDLEGQFVKIVEQKDASEEETAITEINTGCYAFDGKLLLETLDRIRPSNSQSEYYLTDCPAILRADGHEVFAKERFDIHEAMGVNTPDQLAEVQTILQTATA